MHDTRNGAVSAPLLHPEALAGKRALVTGAAKGIGAAVARTLAAAGAEVTALDLRSPADTVEAVRAAGGTATGGVLDVTDRAAAEQVIGALPGLDILVTSAGVYGDPVPIEDLDDEEMDRVFAVNVKGTLWTVRAALPHLRRSRGKIVCLGSLAGKIGGVAAGPQYVASKGALHAMIKGLARTEAPHGVQINAVAPGAVETDMIAGKDYSVDYCLMRRFAAPEEIANVIAFLASPAASYLTGSVVDANGGVTTG
ncbi:MAG TPA: SDR family NAD(P)-dependent oxidoreductase [Pseudonocardia sp.]|jgi:3-oxoacyl-[acyl-carrier protein] reductase|nr:SDR family NAD(P)-dependent oxidoreductase [Pseudonocardia sp.]